MTCASLAGQVYTKQLYALQLGLPQWHPEVQLKLGDVGFFQGGPGGPFFRLLNIFDNSDNQPNDSAPEGFEPLNLPKALVSRISCERNAQALSSLSVKKTEVSVELGR